MPRRNGNNYRKEEDNAILQIIKYINSHSLTLFRFLSTVASTILIYICPKYWSKSHQESVYKSWRCSCKIAIYRKLIDKSSFDNEDSISRKVLQDELRSLFVHSLTERLYLLVIGQHRVEKTTLIQLVVKALPTPKRVFYFNVPMGDVSPTLFIATLQKLIGWSIDPILDASKYISSNVWLLYLKLMI